MNRPEAPTLDKLALQNPCQLAAGSALGEVLLGVEGDNLGDSVDGDPTPRLALLRGGIATFQTRGQHLLSLKARVVEGDPAIGPDRVLAKPRPGSSRPVEDDEDLAALRGYLETEPRQGLVPIDDFLVRRRKGIDDRFDQSGSWHRALPRITIGSARGQTAGTLVNGWTSKNLSTQTVSYLSPSPSMPGNLPTDKRQFSQSPTGFRSTGRLNLDARTQTAYGTLRAFVRYEIARRTGQFHSGTAIRQGNAEPAIGVDFFGQAQHQIVLDKAFIQFAGVTAGRATSFFDFYANDLGWFGIGGGSDRASTNLLAYTASFGSGWSATLSLEDPVERRYPVVTNVGAAALVAGGTLFSGAAAPIQIFNPITGLPINSAFVGQQQRNAMPDIVAAVRVDQPWGSAQLSGIIHQISTIGATIPAGNTFAGANFTGFRPDTEYGYGVQAGVKINLPMIAPGDLLYLQAVYARGCIDCVVGGAWVLGGGTAIPGRLPGHERPLRLQHGRWCP